jgi:excisionase family DNA binding protein
MKTEPNYLSIQQAAARLGVNRRRIWQLIRDGRLRFEPNPLDRRSKLIPVAEVERLAGFPTPPKRKTSSQTGLERPSSQSSTRESPPGGARADRRPYPRTIGTVSDGRLPSSESEQYMRAERRTLHER